VRKKSFILILFGVLPVPQIRESLLRCWAPRGVPQTEYHGHKLSR
jgi:hypothetical protein